MSVSNLAVIACGVLEWNINRLVGAMPGTHVTLRILPAGLHSNPRKLRALLQENIDALSQGQEPCDAILIGYGVCGRGSIGLHSRRLPLVIPRTQDCIGIYLGSQRRYMEEFNRRPGTRYMTQGWYEKTVLESSAASYLSARDHSLYGLDFAELERRYGAENARYICTFRESWQRNYQRAAYIRFEGEEPRPQGLALTEATADSLKWECEVIDGDPSLLQAMLSGNWTDPRLLVVPPFSKTVPAPGADIIGFTSGFDSQIDEILARYNLGKGEETPVTRSGLGLGIDTGGTYTDAVIYDFNRAAIAASTKAPTTHDNLAVGIREALSRLPAVLLRDVKRVGISTTLATNAFVERKGRPVALLLMSPVPVPTEALPFQYVRQIPGSMSIEGAELTPIDPARVIALAREAREAGCEAFAVSGFASVVNPEHEISVAHAIFKETGLPAVCGHQLTSNLNFLERATTAAMNAKLIPLIEGLLLAVAASLREFGLDQVQVMVVKGDGSQMLDRVAREFPVETVLSGPAASVIGALTLFDCRDAVVADMGGTSLDIALVRNRTPRLVDSGATVAGFKTSVRAMAVHTIGLGGDSEIDLSGWPHVTLGPRRIIPICRLRADYPAAADTLATLGTQVVTLEPCNLDFVALAPGIKPEGKLLSCLTDGPLRLEEVARRLNRSGARYIPWRELEDHGRIRRYGLTLTDILHVRGEFDAFDRTSAQELLNAWAAFLETDTQSIMDAIYLEFRRMVCEEILGVTLPDACPWDTDEELRTWLTAHLAGGDAASEAHFSMKLQVPLIPVGAPAGALFPQLSAVFNQQILFSPYAGVANALGAIAGDVRLLETAELRVTDEGGLLCSWRGGSQRANSLTAGLEICEQQIRERLRETAAANNIPYQEPAISATPHQAETRDGTLFLGITVQGRLRG